MATFSFITSPIERFWASARSVISILKLSATAKNSLARSLWTVIVESRIMMLIVESCSSVQVLITCASSSMLALFIIFTFANSSWQATTASCGVLNTKGCLLLLQPVKVTAMTTTYI